MSNEIPEKKVWTDKDVTLSAVGSEIMNVISDNTQQLSVTINLCHFDGVDENGDSIPIIEERVLGFPLDTKTEEITAGLAKYKETYIKELNSAIEDKIQEESLANAKQVIGDLKEFSI